MSPSVLLSLTQQMAIYHTYRLSKRETMNYTDKLYLLL